MRALNAQRKVFRARSYAFINHNQSALHSFAISLLYFIEKLALSARDLLFKNPNHICFVNYSGKALVAKLDCILGLPVHQLGVHLNTNSR